MSALDSFRLDGRRAMVTGGGRGLGAAAAVALAEAGADVVVAGRHSEQLAAVVHRIHAAGGSAHQVTIDVADPEAVEAAFAAAADQGPIDILVNNAGISSEGRALDTSAAEWQRVIDTNLSGAFHCATAFARRRAGLADGAIVNIGSIASAVGVAGQVAYTASKSGIAGLTRALALEFAPLGIRVNALAPGYFLTDMPKEALADDAIARALLQKIPLRRIADPSEIGPPILFLASAASRFMTGAMLHFDGGYTAR